MVFAISIIIDPSYITTQNNFKNQLITNLLLIARVLNFQFAETVL